MFNPEYEAEMQKLTDKMHKDIDKVFSKYDKIPSQGLDKEGEAAELRALWVEFNKNKMALMDKYGVKGK